MYIHAPGGLGQTPTPLIHCGGDMDAIDVKLRIFIPAPAVLVSLPGWYDVAGGDNRGYSYKLGDHRAVIHACARLPRIGVPPSLNILGRNWSETTAYQASDTVAVPGFPSWYVAILPGKKPARRATLQTTVDNLKIALGGNSFRHNAYALASKSTVLSLHADGSNPLVAIAPAINADLNIFLKRENDVLRCLVCGDHDGFPAYELYVNGVLIYCYDPIAAGKSPNALFPPSDIEVNTGWIDILLTTGQIKAGLVCKGPIAQPSAAA
jgi:Protein of unknown function (DUF3238)